GIVGFAVARAGKGAATSVQPGSAHEQQFGTPDDFQQAIKDLKQAFPGSDTVSTDAEDLRIHGFSDYDYRPEDVARMVKIATKYKMPIVPFSGGTSLEGHVRSVRYFNALRSTRLADGPVQHAVGGICVDLSNMDRILEIHGAVS
ncbi:hypothetical protein DXG03_009731, partial [Asterophora parasitica]